MNARIKRLMQQASERTTVAPEEQKPQPKLRRRRVYLAVIDEEWVASDEDMRDEEAERREIAELAKLEHQCPDCQRRPTRMDTRTGQLHRCRSCEEKA